MNLHLTNSGNPMKRFVSIVVITLLASLAACAETGPADPEFLTDEKVKSAIAEASTSRAEEAQSQPSDTSLAADCVYVQWCNAPGGDGTICRLRSGCSYNDTTVAECFADVRRNCGAWPNYPIYPFYLY
jgi:predicted small lipoprotein YifL